MEAPGRRKGSCTDVNEKTEKTESRGMESHLMLAPHKGKAVWSTSHRGPEQPAVPEWVISALLALSCPASRSPVT